MGSERIERLMVGLSTDSSPSPVAPGEVLADKYVVERTLGVGGMGVVVAARHLHINHLVALKFLLPEAASNGIAVARFLREAEAAMSIQSEHVARVTDVGKLASGAPYLVMEYLEGSDLSRWLEKRGPLPVAEAVGYLLQAMVAIAEAHALGIVHRDLKPSNLFLTERSDGQPLVKVLDFGISKSAQSGPAGNLTRTSGAMGSPLYMAPEQIRSAKQVDRRADIWSLGVILQELLTCRTPFMAEEVNGVLAAVVADPPASARASRPDLPVALEQIIMKCLEKDPRGRYGNVAELARALEPYSPDGAPLVRRIVDTTIRKEGAGSVQPTLPGATPPSEPTAVAATAGAWAQPTDERAGRRWVRWAAFTGAMLLVGAVALYLLRPSAASGGDAAVPEGAAAGPPVTAAAPPAPVPAPSPVVAMASTPATAVAAPSPPATSTAKSSAASTAPATSAKPVAQVRRTPRTAPPPPPPRPKKSRDVSELIDDRR